MYRTISYFTRWVKLDVATALENTIHRQKRAVSLNVFVQSYTLFVASPFDSCTGCKFARCRTSTERRAKKAPHWLHRKGRWPSCTELTCRVTSPRAPNTAEHPSRGHRKGRHRSCTVRIWLFRELRCGNPSEHVGHICDLTIAVFRVFFRWPRVSFLTPVPPTTIFRRTDCSDLLAAMMLSLPRRGSRGRRMYRSRGPFWFSSSVGVDRADRNSKWQAGRLVFSTLYFCGLSGGRRSVMWADIEAERRAVLEDWYGNISSSLEDVLCL